MTVASVRSDWAKASIGNRGHRLIGCVNRQTAVTPSRPLERVQAPIPALEADIAGGMKAFDAPDPPDDYDSERAADIPLSLMELASRAVAYEFADQY